MYVNNIQYKWLQDKVSKLQSRGQAHAGFLEKNSDSADKNAKANEEKLQKAPTKLEQALAEIVASHVKMQSENKRT